MQLLRRPGVLFAFLVLLSLAAFAAKDFIMPEVHSAKSYPAHDEHPMEKFTIAADPYDMPDKADIFNENYREHGMMPIFVVFTNDGDQPVTLNNIKVELITRRKDKIPAATEDDLYRRMSRVKNRGDEPSRNPLPIPLPRKKPNVGVSKTGRAELDAAMFSAKAVAPHESQAGFMFFDVSGISQPLAGSRLYITGATNGDGQELMYFEIALEKYLSAPATTPTGN